MSSTPDAFADALLEAGPYAGGADGEGIGRHAQTFRQLTPMCGPVLLVVGIVVEDEFAIRHRQFSEALLEAVEPLVDRFGIVPQCVVGRQLGAVAVRTAARPEES